MTKNIAINAAILASCIPLSAGVAWLALLAGFGPGYVGVSTFGMIVHCVFSPLTSGILTTDDWRQSVILGGPPVLFIVFAVIAVLKGAKWTSYICSALASLSCVAIVVLSIWAESMP